MKRLAAWLICLLVAPCGWGADAEWPAWPRAWTVNVSGPWQISGCPPLPVRQDGHRLTLEPTPESPLRLEGTILGHELAFSVHNARALKCLPGAPEADELRFTGKASGALISGTLQALDDSGARTAITIRLRREFMLSFDDGPLPGKTDRVLDALKQLRAEDGQAVRAAFFTVGDAPEGFWNGRACYAPYEIWTHKGSMRAAPELTARVLAEGHALGNHTAHHAWFRWPRFAEESAVAPELHAWEAAAPSNAGQEKLFRPPYLIASDPVLAAARQAGYQVVLGDTVGDAAPGSNPDSVEWRALQILESRDGSAPALLIFHDILPVTYIHLEHIVTRLLEHGYILAHFDVARLDGKTVIRPH